MGETDSHRKAKWYDNEHKCAAIAILLLMAIVLISLGSINLYQSQRAAEYATPRPTQHIPITREDASSTVGRPSRTTALPNLKWPPSTIKSEDETEVGAKGDFLDSILPDETMTTFSPGDSITSEESNTEIKSVEDSKLPHPDYTTTTTSMQSEVTTEEESLTWFPGDSIITEPSIETKPIPTLSIDSDSSTRIPTLAPNLPSFNHDRATHFTKLDFVADEWYKPVYSIFDSPATYEEAENICETQLTIGDTRHNQTLPSIHMYEAMINKIVEMMPAVFEGKAMWTGLYTYSSLIRDLSDVVFARGYGLPNDQGYFFMTHNSKSFCPPFNVESMADVVWNTYHEIKSRKENKKFLIRIVKDFTYLNKPKSKWPTGWFPGCLRPHDSIFLDSKELNFVCQTSFLNSKDIENWRPPSQPLPFHLNRMKRKMSGIVQKLRPSYIDSVLPLLQLIPIPNPLLTLD